MILLIVVIGYLCEIVRFHPQVKLPWLSQAF